MFIGIQKQLNKIFYYLFPLYYIILLILINTLNNLLIFSPIFLKHHKEYNILFYLHSGLSTFNFFIYFILLIVFSLYFFTYQFILKDIIFYLSIYGFIISIFSLISGIYWGIFSWGVIGLLDNKTYLLIFIIMIYSLFIYLFWNNAQIKKINLVYFIIIIISLPFWKLLSYWWSTLHQSFSITLIGSSFPTSLLIYFIVITGVILFHLCFTILINTIINI